MRLAFDVFWLAWDGMGIVGTGNRRLVHPGLALHVTNRLQE